MNLTPYDNAIRNCIYFIRGQNVMLDCDLAKFYGIKTGALKRAVKRNIKRFPSDFMFELTWWEFLELKRHFSKNLDEYDQIRMHGGSRYTPFAFSEPGVAMLASVLNNEKAVEICVVIVRNFLYLRDTLVSSKDVRLTFDQVNDRFETIEKRLGAIEDIRTKQTTYISDCEVNTQKTNLNNRQSNTIFTPIEVNKPLDFPENISFQILNWVAQSFQVSLKDMKSSSRKRKIIEARHCGMFLVRKYTSLSLSEVAIIFGKRDHSTVINACSKVEHDLNNNPELRRCVHFVKTQLEKN